MKTLLKAIFILIISSTAFSCNSKKTDGGSESGSIAEKIEGEVSISGAFALYPMATIWVEEFNKKYPDVRVHLSAGGSGKGMTDALSGMVNLGMFSRGISQAEKDKGVWWVAVCKDAVFPTISDKNPALEEIKKTGLTQEELRQIFVTGEATQWGDVLESGSGKISVYTRSDASGAAETWAQYLGVHQEDLRGIGVYGDPGVASAVKKDRFGIGYNNTLYIYDIKSGEPYPGLAVAPIDLNANDTIDENEDFYGSLDEVAEAVANGAYPSPPSRELYFVAKGKPDDPVTIAFLEWVLTKGQEFVVETGYVPLEKDYVDAQLKKFGN